jgi:crotonobetainyl-CoA:carnitine CoA-transferase CaiB-like acyl-CoA transferase
MGAVLEGIRVIDLTVWFQGPVAAQHLADFGAEVIHVERPQGGDLGRGVRTIKALPVGDWNQYFLVINRNKKSMAVDLNQPLGREIICRLVECSDVFLSNLSDETLAKWELTYERLSAINPRLIYAVASGYGRYGEMTKPSFDMTVQALTGLMSRLGEPGQPPIYLGMGSGDAIGGLMAALGVLLALYARQRTGKGQLIIASLYGAQLFLAGPTLQAYLATGSERFSRQQSRKAAPNPLWNTYPTKDKWVFLCLANGDDTWSRLCQTLDYPSLSDDPRFDSAGKRRAHAAELIELLDQRLQQRTADEWMERWRALGVIASPINNLADLAQDPQAWANEYLLETYCEEVQRQVMIRGLPIGLSNTPGSVRSLGPELGQHTEEILVDTLGYSWEQVGELKAKGAIL